MAPPSILLREFHTEGISDLIPGKLAQTYQQLEQLVFGISSRSRDEWNVHFHFEDGNCEGKALALFWDEGAYFDDESCLVNGKLRLFAHFETKNDRPTPKATTPKETLRRVDAPQGVPPSAVHDSTAAPPKKKRKPILRRGEGGALVNEHGRPVTIRSNPKQTRPSTTASASAGTRSRVLDLSSASDSDSDASGETQFVMSPSEDTDGDAAEGGATAQPDTPQIFLPMLPQGATVDQYALDFNVCGSVNAPPGQYGHKHNWNPISQGYRDTIAHCRLIHGRYGIPAPTPCDRCKNMGLKCRVYHPALKRPSETCGECRLSTASCSFNKHMDSQADNLRKAVPSKRKVSVVEDDDENGDRVYCPIATCESATKGFSLKKNLQRHIQIKHAGVVPKIAKKNPPTSHKRNRVAKGQGSFLCPVEGCNSRNNRGDNFRRHVRQTHPDTAHAHVLEAVLNKTPLQLPPLQASTDEILAYFDIYEEEIADEQAVGTLPAIVGESLIHARLIQNEYGVLAPESCTKCKKSRKACLVYHPEVVEIDSFFKEYDLECGECVISGKGILCDVKRRPFEYYLASHLETVSDRVPKQSGVAGIKEEEREDGEGADSVLEASIADESC